MLKSKCPLKNCRPIRLQKIQADQLALRVQEVDHQISWEGTYFLQDFFIRSFVELFTVQNLLCMHFFGSAPSPRICNVHLFSFHSPLFHTILRLNLSNPHYNCVLFKCFHYVFQILTSADFADKYLCSAYLYVRLHSASSLCRD